MRQRRRRTAFTDEQLDRLEESFEKERFPGIQIREDLARELNIGEDRIQVKQWINSVAYFWYANFNREYLDNSFVGRYHNNTKGPHQNLQISVSANYLKNY